MAKKEIYNIDLAQNGGQRRSSEHRNTNRSEADRRRPVTSGSAQHSGKKKMTRSQLRRKKRKRLLIIEVVILLLVLAFLFVWLKLGKISWDDLKNLYVNKLDDETQDLLEGYTNIALFGVDNRSNGNYDSGNSDSIMICSINNETKEVKLISVYRDTCFDVDGDMTFRKCNYAYNHGGPQQAIEMLNRNLDLNIQKYVSVDFYALAEASDALGGIELDIPADVASQMNSGYIAEVAGVTGMKGGNVSSGVQRVNGTQAVAFCRIRYTAGGDFGRAERQRQVLQAMVNELSGASIGEMNKLVNAVFDDVGTNFKLNQIIKMASYVKDYKLVETRGFPYDMKTGNYGSQGDMVVPCTLESNVKKLHADLFGNEDMEVSGELSKISSKIQNFTGYGEGDALDYGY
ncbi:MAG: LCP family protein [Lachnospiraceae bacterium]|nr:LCP family protein [Lachnospiraceae bacterium]